MTATDDGQAISNFILISVSLPALLLGNYVGVIIGWSSFALALSIHAIGFFIDGGFAK